VPQRSSVSSRSPIASSMGNRAMTPRKDGAVEVAALLFEARLLVEAVTSGLGKLAARNGSGELAALQRMATQAADALEALQKTVIAAAPEGNA